MENVQIPDIKLPFRYTAHLRVNTSRITMRKHCPSSVPGPAGLRNLSDHKAKPNPEHPLGPLGLRRQEGPQRVGFTLTMEEAVSSGLVPELEQKTLHHCSANTLTAGDLGPGLPRSE